MIPPTLTDPTIGLHFDEAAHRYTYDGEPMDSVTQVVGQFKKKFDSDHWSQVVADRRGVDQSEVLAEWDQKRDSACDTGDQIHQEAERIAWQVENWSEFHYRYGYWRQAGEDTFGKAQALWKWWTDHMEIAQGFCFPELKVVHPEHRIAGTVDLVASNYNGVPSIIDYKQNESIDLMGKYNNMLPPFQRGKLKLPDTNFAAYALQLSLYARILADRYEYHPELLVLVHLKPDATYHEYFVQPLERHVDKILELREGQ